MKIVIITLLIFSLLITVSLAAAGQLSKEKKSPNIVRLQLQACPNKPNCINTEYPEQTSHYRPPLTYSEQKPELVISRVKNIILEMGGLIIEESKFNLSATFTSSFFGFVDDFDIRLNHPEHQLHIRSASRSGYSDFGANKRRVDKFSMLFATKENE
jgi:uncharacterized protein (DUF1499 family)